MSKSKIVPPCIGCPRNYDKPKVCRSECDKWAKYEEDKRIEYANRMREYEERYTMYDKARRHLWRNKP